MKKILLLSILTLLCGTFSAHAALPEAGHVTYVRGDTWVVKEGQRLKLDYGSKVYTGDLVVTDEKARLKLIMADDSTVYIGRNSRIRIKDYSMKDDSLSNGVFNLLWGKVRFIVNKLNANNDFKIRTSTAVLGVRGTDFAVSKKPPTNAADINNRAGKVMFTRGAAWIIRDRERFIVSRGMIILPGDVVVTRESGRVKLAMVDQSTLYVGRQSRLNIEDYSLRNKGIRASLNMLWGKVKFVVAKLKTNDSSYNIRIKTAVIGVRGTTPVVDDKNIPDNLPSEPDIDAPEHNNIDKEITLGLLEGTVKISSTDGTQQRMQGGHIATFPPSGGFHIGKMNKQTVGDVDFAPDAFSGADHESSTDDFEPSEGDDSTTNLHTLEGSVEGTNLSSGETVMVNANQGANFKADGTTQHFSGAEIRDIDPSIRNISDNTQQAAEPEESTKDNNDAPEGKIAANPLPRNEMVAPKSMNSAPDLTAPSMDTARPDVPQTGGTRFEPPIAGGVAPAIPGLDALLNLPTPPSAPTPPPPPAPTPPVVTPPPAPTPPPVVTPPPAPTPPPVVVSPPQVITPPPPINTPISVNPTFVVP
ncbi:MAG: FecR domain-containing protein [Mariprofundaceae bacterium]